MSDLTIHASPEFLNELEWQMQRLSIMIDGLEGLAVSLRDLQGVLNTLHDVARASDFECW